MTSSKSEVFDAGSEIVAEPVEDSKPKSPPSQVRDAEATRARGILGRWWVIVLISFLVTIGSFYGLRALAHSWATETTDDAFTDGHLVPIAPKISGQVRQVLVTENQEVKAGDVLVEMDERDNQLLVELKKAALDAAKASRETAKSGLVLMRAKLETAAAARDQAMAESAASDATATRAQNDNQRAEELKKHGVVSPQELDTAKANAVSAAETLKAARQKVVGAESALMEAKAELQAAETFIDSANIKVKQAELDLSQAELQLSYTKITAPADGRVTSKTVEPGAYLEAGQNVMVLVPKRVWVVANFKETQLRDMRPGQAAAITLSAYPTHAYRGHVDSIQAGSGARFSLLPPENATGNFVKVVQRVPVKIVFDESLENDHVVGPGLSVDPDVTVGAEVPLPFVQGGAGCVGLAVLLALIFRATRRQAAA